MAARIGVDEQNFQALANLSKQFLISLEQASPEMKATLAKKHFCATIPANTRDLLMGSRIGEEDSTGFGSSFFYFSLVQRAVRELRSTYTKKDWEYRMLTRWQMSTESFQEISAVDNYFRARVPGNVALILQGRTPVCQMQPPREADLNAIASYIIKKINGLPKGAMMMIPGGCISHEEDVILEKSHKGVLSILRSGGMIRCVPPKYTDLTRQRWWVEFCRFKYMAGDSLHHVELKLQESGFDHGYVGGGGAGNNCYAQCQWDFLRYLLLRHTPHRDGASFERIARLEMNLKERICEYTTNGDPAIVAFTKRALQKNFCRVIVRSVPEEIKDVLISALQSAEQPLIDREHDGTGKIINPHVYFDYTAVFNEKLAEELSYRELTESLKKECAEHAKFLITTRLFSVAEINFPVLSQVLSSEKASFLFNYLKSDYEEVQELDERFVQRVKTTIELLEDAEFDCLVGGAKKVFNWIAMNTRLRWHPLSARIEARLQGVNEDALKEALNNSDRYRFFRGLQSPQEVAEWGPRLLALIMRSTFRDKFDAFRSAADTYLNVNYPSQE